MAIMVPVVFATDPAWPDSGYTRHVPVPEGVPLTDMPAEAIRLARLDPEVQKMVPNADVRMAVAVLPLDIPVFALPR